MNCLTCGSSQLVNGDDYCYKCLGLVSPGLKWEKKELNEREADFSRVGSKEWVEEMWANREHLWFWGSFVPKPKDVAADEYWDA